MQVQKPWLPCPKAPRKQPAQAPIDLFLLAVGTPEIDCLGSQATGCCLSFQFPGDFHHANLLSALSTTKL